jgi:WD40 repeat protein
VWNLRTGSSNALPPPGGAVTDLALSDDGRRLAVGMKNHEVLAYDVASGDRHRIGIHPAPVYRVAISRDGRWIASDGDDDTTRLWEVPALDELYEVSAVPFGTIAIAGTAVVGGTASGRLLVWSGDKRRSLEAHTGAVLALASSGSLLASAGMDQSIRLWDANTGASRGTLAVTGGRINSLVVTRDERVISAHNDGRVILWDAATPRTLATIHDVRTIGVSPDETLVAAGDGDGVVQLLSTTGAPPRVLGRASGRVWTAQFSPDGRHVATAGLDGAVTVWDVATGASREVAHVHGKIRRALEYSPDGHWLAAASDEGELAVWDLESEQLRTWTGHKGAIGGLGFIGGVLVTSGRDGSVRSWNPRDGALVALARVDAEVGEVALAFGDGFVAAGSANGSVYRWPIDRFREGQKSRQSP